MDLKLSGRVALVAGATAGLGLAVGRALAGEGAAVALCGRRADLAQEQAAQLAAGIGVQLDVGDADSVSRAVRRVQAELGPVDIVVLNSGGPPASPAADLDLDAARSAAELLLFGPIRLVQACLPDMRSRRWGRMVAVGSSAVQQPIPGLTTSSMFRSALASYLKLLADEVAGDGVTVNMVLPGRIATDRVAALDAQQAERTRRPVAAVRQESEGSIPVGRYGSPEEFAAVVTFLCGDSARYVTGEQVRVDGGLLRAL
jgi:3-oxoacyl-[acyl-carrier protein] reductase